MKKNKALMALVLLLLIGLASGCAFAVGTAVGATAGVIGGYELRDHGYVVRDPIAHE
ncbi:MAG: hypothetical protein V3U54_10260 [Thermodesulfobacteriota bacterium]